MLYDTQAEPPEWMRDYSHDRLEVVWMDEEKIGHRLQLVAKTMEGVALIYCATRNSTFPLDGPWRRPVGDGTRTFDPHLWRLRPLAAGVFASIDLADAAAAMAAAELYVRIHLSTNAYHMRNDLRSRLDDHLFYVYSYERLPALVAFEPLENTNELLWYLAEEEWRAMPRDEPPSSWTYHTRVPWKDEDEDEDGPTTTDFAFGHENSIVVPDLPATAESGDVFTVMLNPQTLAYQRSVTRRIWIRKDVNTNAAGAPILLKPFLCYRTSSSSSSSPPPCLHCIRLRAVAKPRPMEAGFDADVHFFAGLLYRSFETDCSEEDSIRIVDILHELDRLNYSPAALLPKASTLELLRRLFVREDLDESETDLLVRRGMLWASAVLT